MSKNTKKKDSRNVQKRGLKSEILDRLLELFYEHPGKKFTVRDIAGKTRVPRATAHEYLNALKKLNLITKDNMAESSLMFKTKKTNYFIERMISSGLISEIISQMNPSCIILFGSIRKGESVQESDIDIFVESSLKKQIELRKFEKALNHNIQLFVENDINSLQPNLFNNVINGIKIYGSIKIK